jgi:D-alanyl-D-alanine carboxypeptidase (penicillin-binding protein 5/6)
MHKLVALLILVVVGTATGALAKRIPQPSHAYSTTNDQRLVETVPMRLTSGNAPLLFTSTESAYAVDMSTMTTLYSQNSTITRPIASLTKMMTIYIIMRDHKLTDVVTVGTLPKYDQADETLGLITGEKFTVEQLVRAALVPSDNDAADALAIYDSGSIAAFISKMNATLSTWQIHDAHYASASGLTDEDNFASANALAKVAKLALTSPLVRALVATKQTTVTDEAGTFYNVTSSNKLLSPLPFYGIKTGYTAAAGQCFVGLTTIKGHEVITVVLGSADRFGDSTALRNWIEGAWKWQ